MGWFKRVLDMLSGNHNLEIKTLLPHYYDSDVVIIHAMFQTFTDFYEAYIEDHDLGLLEENPDKKFIKAMEDASELYKWWQDERPMRVDPIDVDPPSIQKNRKNRKNSEPIIKFIYRDSEHEKTYKETIKKSEKWEEDCYKEDKKMMKKLVDIHRYLIN